MLPNKLKPNFFLCSCMQSWFSLYLHDTVKFVVAAVCLSETDKDGNFWPQLLHGNTHKNYTLCARKVNDSEGDLFVLFC